MSDIIMVNETGADNIEKRLIDGLRNIEQAATCEKEELENKVAWYTKNIKTLFTIFRDMESDQEYLNKSVEESEKKLETQQKELSEKDDKAKEQSRKIKDLKIRLDAKKNKRKVLYDNTKRLEKELQEVRDDKSNLLSTVEHLRDSMQKLQLKEFREQSVQTDYKPELGITSTESSDTLCELLREMRKILEEKNQEKSVEEDECQSSNKSSKLKQKSSGEDADSHIYIAEMMNKYGRIEQREDKFRSEVLRGTEILEVTPEKLSHTKDKSNKLRVHVTTEKVIKHYICQNHSKDCSHPDDIGKHGDSNVTKTTSRRKSDQRKRNLKLGAHGELQLLSPRIIKK